MECLTHLQIYERRHIEAAWSLCRLWQQVEVDWSGNETNRTSVSR